MTDLAEEVLSGEIDLAHATKKALDALRKDLSVRMANEDN
jgi:hypothetical protein